MSRLATIVPVQRRNRPQVRKNQGGHLMGWDYAGSLKTCAHCYVVVVLIFKINHLGTVSEDRAICGETEVGPGMGGGQPPPPLSVRS